MRGRGLHSNVAEQYTTQNGNRVSFVIVSEGDDYGARIDRVDFAGSGDAAMDSFGNASQQDPIRFLNGTVMNSSGHDGFIQISNRFLDTTITLDMRDQARPTRTSEMGEIERAGPRSEVWVNFAWKGPNEGDFFIRSIRWQGQWQRSLRAEISGSCLGWQVSHRATPMA